MKDFLKKIKCSVTLLAVSSVMAVNVSAQDVEVKTGPYSPDWNSLGKWECPEWFKDAKFGIWAHWGPQCQAEDGDWYGRFMYYENTSQFNWHLNHFGDPEEFGLKDLCNAWKAEKWDPEKLIALYKSVGARYFMTLGQHHDNFDLWNSTYQEWNSVNIGPKRDIVKEWSDACKKYDLPLGVSMHGSHSWTWLEPSQEFDGNLTKADGAGKWWEGYDPQELYAQRHDHSTGWDESGTIHSQWNWGNGASIPDEAYVKKFQNRVLQCINDYDPQLLYFDDTVLPFYQFDESVGKNILSHFYNTSAAKHDGVAQVVVEGKILDSDNKKYMLWDVERGVPDRPQDEYWQTCTCLGDWHYSQSVYNNNSYKKASTVIRMLVDIVSKNGNMLLSVPVKADGTIDDKEEAILAGIKAWMDQNSESIYGTRVWKTFGEGPLAEAVNPINAQGFNEGANYSSKDVRYVEKDGVVYATIMAWPTDKTFSFKAFSLTSAYYSGQVKSAKLLGYGDVEFTQDLNGLNITLPDTKVNDIAPVIAITLDDKDLTPFQRLTQMIEGVESFIQDIKENGSYINTGKYSTLYLPEVENALKAAKEVKEADGPDAAEKACKALEEAYSTYLQTGKNKGGKLEDENAYDADLTTEKLMEAENFMRENSTSTRFGKPYYWTVENFKIDNGGDGVKEGLDHYPGYECLMLGVWDDQDKNADGSLANARIYRKVKLDAGTYFFGAAYNTTYNISSSAYMFASKKLYETAEIPDNSIAFIPLTECGNNDNSNSLFGLWFKLEEDTEIYLGWQADLTGASTQEFRAKKVALLKVSDANPSALSELILTIDSHLTDMYEGGKVNNNTGFYSPKAYEEMQATFDDIYEKADDASYEDAMNMYFTLSDAWDNFLANGKNVGGKPDMDNCADITIDKLTESQAFTRKDPSVTTRFAAPYYWTVENFSIPNGGDGIKQGLDGYEGTSRESLMLGVWNDRDNNEDGDISNARIYQKVELEKGRYFFGAAYNALYNLYDAYVFVSDEIIPTSQMSDNSIAYFKIADGDKDLNYYGLYFDIDEDVKDVYLGFQANLAEGDGCQEFRAEKVLLLKYSDVTRQTLLDYIAYVDDQMDYITEHVNNNTGFFSNEAYNSFIAQLETIKTAADNASGSEITDLYNELREVYAFLLNNGRNEGGIPDEKDSEDITEEYLVQREGFARVDPSVTTRFSTPLNWTVENICIDKGGEGIKRGLDNYPGKDHLMLGIWDDRNNNTEGDLTNARIFKTLHLSAGRYFFGGTFETTYNMAEAYIYATLENVPTDEIKTNSTAWYSVSNCGTDGNYYGLYFDLDEAADICVGFQADLSQGPSAQEMRVAKVKLLRWGEPDVIVKITNDNSQANQLMYNLAGQRVGNDYKGIVIQNGKKFIRK